MEEAQNEVRQLGGNIPPEKRKEMLQALEHVQANAPFEEDKPAPEQEQEQPQEPQAPAACPRCGHAPDTSTPNADDVREYTRAILGSRVFTKSYELLDGQIGMNLAALTGEESDALNNHILELKGMDDPVEFSAVLSKYRVLYYLRTLKVGDADAQAYEAPAVKGREALESEFSKRFAALPEAVIGMAVRVTGLFRTLDQALVAQSFDENFWTGAGPF